jgi:DNA polymerase-3 subunit alpha
VNFVNLHCHSHFSILDGLSTEEEIAERTAELGQTAVALTDHGSLSGAIKFQRACVERGVKPILGCEVYVAPGHRSDHEARCVDGKGTAYHLILLAQNQQGWHNLVKLTTLANTEGFYRKPRVDTELLEQYNEGLICLSGCLGGEVSQNILSGSLAAESIVNYYRAIFGDRYFLEIQRHGLGQDEEIVNDELLALARLWDVPLVATGDSHYARVEDAELHDLLLCIQTLDRKSNPERKFQFKGSGYHLMSDEEMWMLDLPKEAYSNSGYIADTVEEITFDHTPHIPQVPHSHSSLVNALWSNPLTPVEEERLLSELTVISKHGFESYFLVVADICKWARAHGITVGPGRGSAGGSLVAYMLGITDVDPLRFGTKFERFMTAERMKMPDIDIDFSERAPVIQYIQSKYGVDNVSQVATFSKFGEKSSTRDIARALELEPWDDKVIAIAKRLEGRVRGVSRHAAGVIISPEPLSDGVPLMRPVGATPGADKQTAFEYEDMEALGYLKIDVLGVQRLATIADCVRSIRDSEA